MIAFATAWVASTIGAHFDGLYNLPDGQTLAEAVKAGTRSLKFSIEIGRAMAHGLSGGVFSELGGGDFGGGFAAGAFGSLAGSAMTTAKGQGFFGQAGDGDFTGLTKRTVAAAIVGGTAAELGGGKFANGAYSAAFSSLVNQQAQANRITEIINEENPRLKYSGWTDLQKNRVSLGVASPRGPGGGVNYDGATFLQVELATAEYAWEVEVTYAEYAVVTKEYLGGLIKIDTKGELVRTYTKTETRYTYKTFRSAVIPLPPGDWSFTNLDGIPVPEPVKPTSWYRNRRDYRYDARNHRITGIIYESDKYTP